MYMTIKEPSEKIANQAVQVWRISNTIGHGIAIIVLGILLYCSEHFHWYGWIQVTLYIILGIIVLSAVYSIFIEPVFLQKTWRYEIDEDFVQMKNGKWNESHTLVPMEKVEFVRTEQGPIMRKFDLFNLIIGTTTTQHTIPAIPAEKAKWLKVEIAQLAKVKESDLSEREEE
ncbi:PH domain-containing protein [Sutcliffiella horikoshii]|uniref:PH domain-containing protein n=1 Tax=Sutcliffiella horikoshii TaxID=79883 RepID=UPI001CBC583F|nr:PH domain-containing protein [Sutcliffiella horikoshii]UAL47381.1 PH domain-containing protein [Sutcliffiella horikoshii]